MGPVVEVRAGPACWPTSGSPSKTWPWPRSRFANGALGIIEASTAIYPGYLKRIEIHGSDRLGRDGGGRHRQVGLRQARPSATRRSTQKMAQRKSGGGGAADPKAIGHHGHARQFQDVLKAIKKGTQPAGRRPRRPPLGRDHPGDLQGGRDRPGRRTAAAGRPGAEGPEGGGRGTRKSEIEQMKSFEDNRVLRQTLTPGLLSTVRVIGEFKGKQDLWRERFPEVLSGFKRWRSSSPRSHRTESRA